MYFNLKSNYNAHCRKKNIGVVLCGVDSFKGPKCDCKFQHFAVIIRSVTAKC